MKVLHITNNYPTHKNPVFGIFVKEQIDSLAWEGVNNEVLFINGRENGKFEYARAIIRIKKHLKSNYYDIIHCHHALSALCLILSGKYRTNKFLVSYQNDPKNEFGLLIFKFIKKYASAIILKNQSNLVDNQLIYNIPNGVDINIFLPFEKEDACKELNIDPAKDYVLFVSSNFLRKQKRYDKFNEVIKILKSKNRLENLTELKLINISRDKVPYYFNAATLHLLTSDFEGSPNSVKEAMASNLPVVSTNVGNVSELLTGVTGSYVAKSNSVKSLAECALKVFTTNNKTNSRQDLINKGLDIKSIAKRITSLYKIIIS